MSERVTVVWDEAFLAYDLGPQHPLKPVRVKLTVELARACGLLDAPGVEVVAPRPATRAELESVHTPAYIDAVRSLSGGGNAPFGSYGNGLGTGDNPVFEGMHDSASLISGGCVVAAERVWRGDAQHAFLPAAGAQHHAMPDRASGFGIYDDIAIAMRSLLDAGASRIAYVDVDVHHGDGVQAAFYDDPRVLTISLHESGYFLFPGTGFVEEKGSAGAEGTSVNVPLAPYTHDDAYIEAFEAVVPPLVESFRPDVLVTQLGCDTHATDPLAHLALTTRTYRHLASRFHALAHDLCAGRWLATGGGGYQIYAVVPRAWTIALAEQAGRELPAEVPRAWIDAATDLGANALPRRFDDPGVDIPRDRANEATIAAREAAAAVRAEIFPAHGIA